MAGYGVPQIRVADVEAAVALVDAEGVAVTMGAAVTPAVVGVRARRGSARA